MIDPEAVRRRIGTFLKVPAERLADEAALAGLVRESFLLVQLVIDLQEEFGARLVQEDLRDVRTVADLVRAVVTHPVPGSSS